MNSDILGKIVKESLAGKKHEFGKEIKEFALTLNYYSPRAYLYVRKSFANVLPHPRTLRRWYMVVDGKPGFTSEAIETIKGKVSQKKIYCNLIIDEMCVKRRIESDTQQNTYGHVNLGTDISYDCDDDKIPLAHNALVFMVVCMNGYWKLPIGYFLIDGLSGQERSNLFQTSIELITNSGAHIHSVTFDGAPVNQSMYSFLGANLKSFKPFISNSITKEKINIFLDPAHMLKLVRNAFGEKKCLINSKGEFIKWDYIVKLYEKENAEGLRLATKLTNRHILYMNEKMNVRLASQVLSNSVSDALIYLKDKDPLFIGCEATAEFCQNVNNAFDILNSRKLHSKNPYNNAITEKTFENYQEFTNKFTDYINGLKFQDGTRVTESQRKTGFIGLVIGSHNAFELFKLLFSKGDMNFLITYKLSQDHLETFFSAIRGKGGYNDNPTCRQFQAAYKRLLVHNAIVGSEKGNCSILDNTKILAVDKNKLYAKEISQYEQNVTKTQLHDHDYFSVVYNMSAYVEDVSVYIAGFVTLKLQKKIDCNYCKSFLTTKEHVSKLAFIKDRGGLQKPSTDVQTVCIETEKVFRQYVHDIMLKKKSKQFIVLKVKSNIHNRYIIFNNMPCVNENRNLIFDYMHQFDTHRDNLIKLVCESYFNLRFFHEVKKSNDIITMRQKYTKLIHFRHE